MSDKTTAALAAEQADAEATTTQKAELLPAATLDELEQIADLLDVARPTVVRDWRMARAWLQRELA
mgnify:CR=1 FL=1